MVTSVLDQVDKPPHVDHGNGHDDQVRIVPGKVCKFQIGKNEEPEQCGEYPEHHTSGGNNSTHHVVTHRFYFIRSMNDPISGLIACEQSHPFLPHTLSLHLQR